jgi:CMP-N,N'-diacetyllegionaminic acid synthase
MNLLVTICARGGSKGIPGKNIKLLNGKPLLAYSIEVASRFSKMHGGDIAISTDSDDILAVAKEFGVVSNYVRPAHLSGDKAGKADTIRHLLEYTEAEKNKKYDFVLDLDVTSPLRTMDDLQNAFEIFRTDSLALNIFSVSPASRNPYFNMVQQRGDGYMTLVKEGSGFKSRQEAPIVYDMNASFYFFRRAFFSEGWNTAITDRSLAYVVPHLCFDLDHPHDFTVMEVLMKQNLLGFSL